MCGTESAPWCFARLQTAQAGRGHPPGGNARGRAGDGRARACARRPRAAHRISASRPLGVSSGAAPASTSGEWRSRKQSSSITSALLPLLPRFRRRRAAPAARARPRAQRLRLSPAPQAARGAPRRSWDPGILCRKADRPPSKSDVALPRACLLIARAPLQAGASLADRPGPPHRPRRRRRRRPPRHRRPGPSRAWRGRPRAGAPSAARPPAGMRPPGPRAPSPSRRTAARAARRPPVSGGAAALPGSVMRRSGCAPRREHPSSDSALAASASLSSEHSARGSAA